MKHLRPMDNVSKSSSAGRAFAVLLFLMLSAGVFGQNTSSVEPVTESTPANTETSVRSKMEMLFWFMGTKQAKSTHGFGDDEVTSQKKQFIRSGTTPNRILSRTFMQKALNYETTLA